MKFPKSGMSRKEIMGTLNSYKAGDLKWRTGKNFAYTYHPGAEAESLIHEAYTSFLQENALDPTAFPSLLRLETEVISMAADLVHGDENCGGTFTSGGTESIMLSLKTARDYARFHHPDIVSPEVVLPHTAHGAFHKACDYLDLVPVTVPVDKNTFKADPKEIEKAITKNTILLVASAPSYAHGVIDPIETIGQIALRNELLFHVDSCVGGFFLPFAEQLGYSIPHFDFRVPGVTQISMDFHKFGYAAKGASCILHKDVSLRKYQIFSCSKWAGYTIINPGVTSTKSGGPMAACWAVLNFIAGEGYKNIVDACMKGTQAICERAKKIEGLKVLGEPSMNMLALASDDFSIFKLADQMKSLGWFIQPQLASSSSQENVHITVAIANVPHVEAMLDDLENCVEEIRNSDAEPNTMNFEAIGQMLQNFDAAQLPQLLNFVGAENGQLPEQMEMINTLLNQIPSKERDLLLIEFVNQLYVDKA